MTMEDKYLTIKEVAEILGVTPLTLRNWDKKGVLTAYRNPANNYRLYRYAEVSDFVAEIRKSKARRSMTWKIPVIEVMEPSTNGTESNQDAPPVGWA